MATHDAASHVSRRKFIVGTGAAGVAGLAGCTTNPDDGSDDDNESGGEVVITGSSTVFPISDRIAEEFMQENPDVNVTVDSTGTGGGFENHFCPGDSAINGASRPIEEEEVDNCQSNDIDPIEFEVAGDALTVAVNNDADWVDCMTFEELSQIWRDDGAETWSDVRDEWPDEEIELFGPASTSGTYDWFNENVVGEDRAHTAEHEPTEEDNLIVQGIQDSRYAIGYFGLAYYSANSDAVKAIEIESEDGDCTQPSLSNAADGSYPMSRPLYIYANGETLQREEVYDFVSYYLETAATDVVEDIGYVPSSEEIRDENLNRLEEAAGN